MRIQDAFFGIFANFPIRPVAWAMQAVTFPTGRCYQPPSDKEMRATANLITTESGIRSILSETVFVSDDATDRVRQINDALPKCRKAKRDPTAEEQLLLDEAEAMRELIIQVD